jgi:hypothetical protein
MVFGLVILEPQAAAAQILQQYWREGQLVANPYQRKIIFAKNRYI